MPEKRAWNQNMAKLFCGIPFRFGLQWIFVFGQTIPYHAQTRKWRQTHTHMIAQIAIFFSSIIIMNYVQKILCLVWQWLWLCFVLFVSPLLVLNFNLNCALPLLDFYHHHSYCYCLLLLLLSHRYLYRSERACICRFFHFYFYFSLVVLHWFFHFHIVLLFFFCDQHQNCTWDKVTIDTVNAK